MSLFRYCIDNFDAVSNAKYSALVGVDGEKLVDRSSDLFVVGDSGRRRAEHGDSGTRGSKGTPFSGKSKLENSLTCVMTGFGTGSSDGRHT